MLSLCAKCDSLYSITTNQAAIITLFRVDLPPIPGVFPDYPAPVVRNTGGEREMVMMPDLIQTRVRQ